MPRSCAHTQGHRGKPIETLLYSTGLHVGAEGVEDLKFNANDFRLHFSTPDCQFYSDLKSKTICKNDCRFEN